MIGRRQASFALLSKLRQLIVVGHALFFSMVIHPSHLFSVERWRAGFSVRLLPVQLVGFVSFDLFVGDGGLRQRRIARETERGQRRVGHVDGRHVHDVFLGGFSHQRDRHDEPREVDFGGSVAGGVWV